MSSRELALLAAVFLGLQLPFLGSGFVVDEGWYVDHAAQVLRAPLDAYGFDAHASVTREFYRWFANPPGMAFWLAPVLAIAGASEAALRLATFPLAVLALLGTWLLARELGAARVAAPLLLAVSPAFLLSGRTVMADAPAVGLLVLGVALFVRAVEHGRGRDLALAALATGLAPLFKYSAALGIALLALYAAMRRAPPRVWLAVAAAALPLALWTLASALLYGTPHLFAAAAVQEARGVGASLLEQPLAALTDLGAAGLLAPFLAYAAVRGGFALGRAHGIAVVALGLACALFWLLAPFAWQQEHTWVNRALAALLLGAGAAAATWLLLGLAHDARRLREGAAPAVRVLLAVQALGFVAVDASLRFATPKYLLGALPALALLLLAPRAGQAAPLAPVLRIPALLATAGLALALAWVQAAHGDAHRAFARAIPTNAAGAESWFRGPWGFRYYAERRGHRPLGPPEQRTDLPAPGDWVLLVPEAWGALGPELRARSRIEARQDASHVLPLRLWGRDAPASWWAHGVGRLPFVISTEPLARLRLYRVAAPPPRARSSRSR